MSRRQHTMRLWRLPLPTHKLGHSRLRGDGEHRRTRRRHVRRGGQGARSQRRNDVEPGMGGMERVSPRQRGRTGCKRRSRAAEAPHCNGGERGGHHPRALLAQRRSHRIDALLAEHTLTLDLVTAAHGSGSHHAVAARKCARGGCTVGNASCVQKSRRRVQKSAAHRLDDV